MGNKNSGRRPSILVEANTQKILDDAAPHAAKLLADHARGYRKRLSFTMQRACEYIIDHTLGKPRQKIEHSGSVMTYAQLAKEADKVATEQPALLIDAEKIGKN